ncbi:MAG TPA: histidine--tRNA ligase [Desulfobacteria bacterium]|nr:histidine--tRNA ligase [Desulfobacteria bacterium]
MLTQRPKGTNDFLPGQVEKWQFIESTIREICRQYGYEEVRTPIFEHTELFNRGVGETTDIVEKEMYTFADKGDRSITLRPEGTASVCRAYVENKLYAGPQPVKLYYVGPMFRYEKPQAGRFRQFHQFGVEVFGATSPAVDAEVITLAMDFYRRLGLKNLEVHINSVGCPKCRPIHKEKLKEFLRPNLANFCRNCQGRFERNPLRMLDCKSEVCQKLSAGAPTTTQCLCDDCAAHFEQVKSYLDRAGIRYKVDERLVRGLDYYTKTAFEIMVDEIGAQSAICGGGRYDGLIEQLGGPAVPGIGFALGMERIFSALAVQEIEIPLQSKLDVFIAALGEEASRECFRLQLQLRQAGLKVDMDYLARGLKGQLKAADRLKAKFALIIGDKELAQGVALVRQMDGGEQAEIKLTDVVDYLKANC